MMKYACNALVGVSTIIAGVYAQEYLYPSTTANATFDYVGM